MVSTSPNPPAAVAHVGEGDERVAYLDEGNGPAALFVHVGMWSYVWRDVIATLRTEFRCIAPDAPASGLSGGDPRRHATLRTAATRLSRLVETLDLRDLTLVFHDLGGPVAVAAAGRWPERVRALVAVNTFAWHPNGLAFRGMLATMGSAPVRTLDVGTGLIPRMSSTRFGAGRHFDRAQRRQFRAGLDHRGRSSFHRYFADARRSDIWPQTESALERLRDLPLTTVFGARNDPLRFQLQWRARFPHSTQVVVPHGYHFPMCDDPAAVAAAVRSASGRS
ncbi:MAG TPA: alpha/beta fold hydrolase [Acidimicrobiales bacterium]|nr:alpha/beta fold hydrolase [Acidimicrobiales bacterium]